MRQFKKLVRATALTLMISPLAANAGIRILDFDYDANGAAITDGQIIDNEYASWGVNVYGCNVNGNVAPGTDQETGVCNSPDDDQTQSAFNTLNSGSQDNDLEFYSIGNDEYRTREGNNEKYAPLTNYQAYYEDLYNDSRADSWKSPGNVMIIHERPGDCSTTVCSNPDDEGSRPAGFFVFDFASAVDILSLDFFDIEIAEANRGRPDAKLFFFLANGSTQVFNVPETGNGNYKREMYPQLFDVTKMVVNLPGSGGINNLVYRQNTTSTATVSAPSMVALFMLAICSIFYRKLRK